MKLLLDQHLSRKLVPRLQPLFPGSEHVLGLGLGESEDEEIWSFALDGGFVITSKDVDFHVLSFMRGHPPKVIWLRSGNGPSEQVFEILARSRALIEAFVVDPARAILTLP